MRYKYIKDISEGECINFQDKWYYVSSSDVIGDSYHIVSKVGDKRMDIVLDGKILILTK